MNKSDFSQLDIDLMPYYKWYANWRNWDDVTAEDIRDGKIEHPYTMLSDWLDIVSLPIDKNLIGKEVFYSTNAVHENEITYDVYLEGCRIRKGIVKNIHDNIIQIDSKNYFIPEFNREGLLFDKMEYCLLSLHYDGEDIYEGPELKHCFCSDLFEVKC